MQFSLQDELRYFHIFLFHICHLCYVFLSYAVVVDAILIPIKKKRLLEKWTKKNWVFPVHFFSGFVLLLLSILFAISEYLKTFAYGRISRQNTIHYLSFNFIFYLPVLFYTHSHNISTPYDAQASNTHTHAQTTFTYRRMEWKLFDYVSFVDIS